MRHIASRLAFVPVLAAALLATSCDNAVTLPTPPDQAQGYDVYAGPLDPQGRNNYLVTLDIPTTVQVMLAGVVLDNPLRSLDQLLTVHIGTWDGATCTDVDSVQTAPRMTAVLQRQLAAGTHCVSVSDKAGLLSNTVGTVVRVVGPPLLGTGGTPGTETFASAITPSGRATRTIEASSAGTIRITLTSLSPSSGPVGLALGIPATDGSGCQLAKIVSATPGSSPQINESVDAGFYCMALYDLGTFTAVQNFSATIVHP